MDHLKQTILETKNLTRHFGGLVAVDHVNFSLEKGETRAIIGPNGAGKSTLVAMICGRIPSTAGEIIFKNQNITKIPAWRRIRLGMAYTFQITSIFARLSLAENVRLATDWKWKENNQKAQQAALDALDKVGLRDRAQQNAGDLSYGHQRLLEIAMGISRKPELLVLDEPTQGLADSEINAFVKLIRDLAGDMTILLIEHNMNVVMDTADTITVLDLGKVLATGSPAEIRKNKAVQAAYLGEDHA